MTTSVVNLPTPSTTVTAPPAAPTAAPAPNVAPPAPAPTPTANAPPVTFNPLDPSTVTPPPARPVTPAVQHVQSDQVITPTAVPAPQSTPGVDSEWLNNLLNGKPTQQPAQPQPIPTQAPAFPTQQQPVPTQQPLAPTQQPAVPTALPDIPQPDVEFMPTPAPNGLPNQDPNAQQQPQENSELAEIRKMLNDLKGETEQNKQRAEFDKQVEEQMAALRQKYGTADPKVLEEFGDIIQTIRASFGEEFMGDTTRQTLELKQQLQDMRNQFQALTERLEKQPEPTANDQPAPQDTNGFRNWIASAIPNYQSIISSDYFKQLLTMPVDPHNPGYTYNHKLGNMYRAQQTHDIMQFFAGVAGKLNPAATTPNVVVDPGVVPNPSATTQSSLTTQQLSDVLTKVMSGELKVSEADMLKLRQEHARLSRTG